MGVPVTLNDATNDEEKELYASIHRDSAINTLYHLLSVYIKDKRYKKADLLAYWFEDFARYNVYEENFDPKRLKKYNRGDVIKVNLGFNVGNEEGGLHYVIVLDKYNPLSSGTLTVIPLTSIKNEKKYNEKTTVNLGNEIYQSLFTAFNHKNKLFLKKISPILVNKSKNMEIEGLAEFTNEISYLNKMKAEIAKMKMGSIALVNQITTISKQRIYNPQNNQDILAGLKVSSNSLDLIDNKIKKLFLK